jgi:transcriptional regulator with XRE-family HTH domain
MHDPETGELKRRIGRNVLTWIGYKGIDQKTLADRMKVSETFISLIIDGKRITIRQVRRLAEALEIEIADLFR